MVNSLEELKEKFLAGEISAEEFEHNKKEIEQQIKPTEEVYEAPKTEEKKEEFEHNKKEIKQQQIKSEEKQKTKKTSIKKKTWVLILIILGMVIITISTKGFGLLGSTPTGSAIDSEEIKISLSEISEKAKWYEYDSNGANIKFFIVKASDGSIKTAFDACDVCYRNKRGYRQEGNYMVCNNCGKKFLIDSLGTENKNPGGCWPGYLPNLIKDGDVVIKKSDLEKGGWRFA